MTKWPAPYVLRREDEMLLPNNQQPRRWQACHPARPLWQSSGMALAACWSAPPSFEILCSGGRLQTADLSFATQILYTAAQKLALAALQVFLAAIAYFKGL